MILLRICKLSNVDSRRHLKEKNNEKASLNQALSKKHQTPLRRIKKKKTMKTEKFLEKFGRGEEIERMESVEQEEISRMSVVGVLLKKCEHVLG